jgi:hypothetical protein
MSDTLTNALAQSARSGSVLDGIAHPAVVNPLAGYGSAAGIVGQMQGLDESYAHQALGQAYQGAVDKATGKFDPLKFNQLVAADPRAARMAGAGIESSQGLQGQQQSLANVRNAAVNSAITAALAEPDNANLPAAVVAQTQRLVNAGVIPQDAMHAALLDLPSDPAQLRQRLETLRVQGLPPELAQQNIYGRPFTQTGPGGVTIGGVQSPKTGAVSAQPGQGVPQGMSPESSNEIIQIGTNTDNSPRMGTKQQGINLAQGRDANDNGPGGALGTGRLPPALRNPQAPGAAPSPAPAPGFTVGQGPAAAAAQTTTGTASAGSFQGITADAVKARSQDALLSTMLGDAQGFRPGPGADIAQSIKRSIVGIGAQFGTSFGIDPDKLAKQESLQKIGNQLADAQGAGSDARLRVSEGANPSAHNTPAGLDLIIRQLRGNTDYLRARAQLAASYPNKADISGFESQIGANLDPRVFQYERLQPSQRKDYFNGISDKAAFVKAHDWASTHGLLGDVGG